MNLEKTLLKSLPGQKNLVSFAEFLMFFNCQQGGICLVVALSSHI
jgi:hypothetical protein